MSLLERVTELEEEYMLFDFLEGTRNEGRTSFYKNVRRCLLR